MTQRRNTEGIGCLEVVLIVMVCLWLTGNCSKNPPPIPATVQEAKR